MNSSYSSLDLVLSHWAHFFICVYVCALCVYLFTLHVVLFYHGGVDLVGLKHNR